MRTLPGSYRAITPSEGLTIFKGCDSWWFCVVCSDARSVMDGGHNQWVIWDCYLINVLECPNLFIL